MVNYRTMAPVKRLRRGAEYHTVVLERPPAGHVAVNYTKIALEEQVDETEPQPEEQVLKKIEDETLAVAFL